MAISLPASWYGGYAVGSSVGGFGAGGGPGGGGSSSGVSGGSYGRAGYQSTYTGPRYAPKPIRSIEDYKKLQSQTYHRAEPVAQEQQQADGDERWLATEIADALNKGTLIPQAAFEFAENTSTGRLLANGYQQVSKAEMAATMKLAKPLTRGIAVVNIAATGMAATKDFVNGRYKSGTARIAVWGFAAGISIVPGVGWGIALGIGVADAIWGERFYNYVENKW